MLSVRPFSTYLALLHAHVFYRYWGTSETLLPVYQDVAKAISKHTDVDTVVNFASSRSVYSSTMELMQYPQIKSIAIIAEGVPERVRPKFRVVE